MLQGGNANTRKFRVPNLPFRRIVLPPEPKDIALAFAPMFEAMWLPLMRGILTPGTKTRFFHPGFAQTACAGHRGGDWAGACRLC